MVTAGTVIVLIIAIATVLGMGWILSSTRVGVQVRAISERPVVAELLGVPLFARTALVWGVTGLVSATGMLVVASNLPGSFSSLGFLVFPAMAAALIGAFRRLPLAFVGGIGVGVVESVSSYPRGLVGVSRRCPIPDRSRGAAMDPASRGMGCSAVTSSRAPHT